MASVSELRDAVKTTLEANMTGVHVYDTVPDAPNVLPCVVIIPFTAAFDQAMGRGTDQWVFDLLVLCSGSEMDVRQDQLDSFITGAGSNSIRQIIFQNRALGRSDCDAYVSELTEYGMRFPAAEIDHVGARLKLIIYTVGTS